MKAHGILQLTWRQNTLYAEAFGPFNEEGVIEASKNYLDALGKPPSATFSVIEVWDENSMTSPDALRNVGRLWSVLANYGCCSFALTVSNKLQESVAQPYLPEIGKIFNNLDDAELWLKR